MATVSDGQPRNPGRGPAGANKALAAAIGEAGCSYASLAVRFLAPHYLSRRTGEPFAVRDG